MRSVENSSSEKTYSRLNNLPALPGFGSEIERSEEDTLVDTVELPESITRIVAPADEDIAVASLAATEAELGPALTRVRPPTQEELDASAVGFFPEIDTVIDEDREAGTNHDSQVVVRSDQSEEANHGAAGDEFLDWLVAPLLEDETS